MEDKIYYSIREVAKRIGVEPYVLRFWEKEFPALKPKKGRSGARMYQTREIEIAEKIRHLLYDRKFTIDGARSFMKAASTNGDAPEDVRKERVIKTIRELKAEIEELLKLFP